MNSAIRIYQYLAPPILAPLSFYLWWRTYGSVQEALVPWLIPVLWAYIVPGVGTNVFKVWEFDVRLKLGRFRPHHGLVFGSATSTIAWLVHGGPAGSLADVARYALVLCSVLGFWNLLYDIKAIQAGVLKVYNQAWAQGGGAAAIALDYAPWIFGGFGLAYGCVVAIAEWFHLQGGVPDTTRLALTLVTGLAMTIIVPIGSFVVHSRLRHGHYGLRPVSKAS
jgi:hypothetical protein